MTQNGDLRKAGMSETATIKTHRLPVLVSVLHSATETVTEMQDRAWQMCPPPNTVGEDVKYQNLMMFLVYRCCLRVLWKIKAYDFFRITNGQAYNALVCFWLLAASSMLQLKQSCLDLLCMRLCSIACEFVMFGLCLVTTETWHGGILWSAWGYMAFSSFAPQKPQTGTRRHELQ